jgi:hypothetical protein
VSGCVCPPSCVHPRLALFEPEATAIIDAPPPCAPPPKRAALPATAPSENDPWPAPPADAAFAGLLGEIVAVLAPATEADPTAILVQLLVSAGSVLGRHPHYRVGASRHATNEFVILVGPSGSGRKGSSRDAVEAVVAEIDAAFVAERVACGLSSGEGLLGERFAEEIWRAACEHDGPITRTEIRDLFDRNKSKAEIDAALSSLVAAGRIDRRLITGRGRPVEVWSPRRASHQGHSSSTDRSVQPCPFSPIADTTAMPGRGSSTRRCRHIPPIPLSIPTQPGLWPGPWPSSPSSAAPNSAWGTLWPTCTPR